MTDKPEVTNTVVVSDLHIGSDISRVRDCLDMLRSYRDGPRSYRFRRLIVLGDLLDSMDADLSQGPGREFMELLAEISRRGSGVKLVLLAGNHDPRLSRLTAKTLGCRARTRYLWRLGHRRFIAKHGHQFDPWMSSGLPYWLMDVPERLIHAIQRVKGPLRRLGTLLRQAGLKLLMYNHQVATGIRSFTEQHRIDANIFICGHTHQLDSRCLGDGCWYFNCGCWVGHDDPTYLTINDEGEVTARTHRAAETAGS